MSIHVAKFKHCTKAEKEVWNEDWFIIPIWGVYQIKSDFTQLLVQIVATVNIQRVKRSDKTELTDPPKVVSFKASHLFFSDQL